MAGNADAVGTADSGVVWQVCLNREAGQWLDYKPPWSLHIESCHQTPGATSLELCDDESYPWCEIDFKEMTQQNLYTCFVRKIRRLLITNQ